MESQRLERALKILKQVLTLSTQEQGKELSRLCAGDTGLQSLLQQMLQYEMGEEISSGSMPVSWFGEDQVPDKIGPYEIIRSLGKGGMGRVFLARQTQPFEREVALKVMRANEFSRLNRARFEAEYKFVANLNHPSIAQIFDAGSLDGGLLFFSMEYVDGVRIDTYCDHRKLPLQDRVELFLQGCEGILHAHQRGVIHRDIKPDHLMVIERDGKPLVKIIDFGIAKNLESNDQQTQADMVVGTPYYIAPEQIKGKGTDVRSDVFGLAMTLYKLLVGVLPFADSKKRLNLIQQIALYQNQFPLPAPSQRLKSVSDLEMLANVRNTSAKSFRQSFQQDWDWVFRKALSAEPDERYPSVSDLIQECRNILEGLPVSARRGRALYVFQKFVQRHKFGVLATSLFGLLLMGGSAAVTWSLIEAKQANVIARQETAISQEVTKYLEEMLASANPHEGGKAVTVVEVLSSAAESLKTQFEDQPEVKSKLLLTLARSLRDMGKKQEAETILNELFDLDPTRVDPILIFEGRILRGEIFLDSDRTQQGVDLYRELIPELENVANVPPMVFSTALNNLGVGLFYSGDMDEGTESIARAWKIRREALGPVHEKTLTLHNNYMVMKLALGVNDEVVNELVELCDLQRDHLGGTHYTVLNGDASLGYHLRSLGRFKDAEEILLDTTKRAHTVLTEENHLFGVLSMYSSDNFFAQGKLKLALETARVGVAYYEDGSIEPNRFYRFNLQYLAEAYLYLRDFEEAAKVQARVIQYDEKQNYDIRTIFEDTTELYFMNILTDSPTSSRQKLDDLLKENSEELEELKWRIDFAEIKAQFWQNPKHLDVAKIERTIAQANLDMSDLHLNYILSQYYFLQGDNEKALQTAWNAFELGKEIRMVNLNDFPTFLAMAHLLEISPNDQLTENQSKIMNLFPHPPSIATPAGVLLNAPLWRSEGDQDSIKKGLRVLQSNFGEHHPLVKHYEFRD